MFQKYLTEKNLWLALRIGMGIIMLWPFLDKSFGLGFSTMPGKAWIDGASPTTGFLSRVPVGPLALVFKAMANNPIVDVLFMGGLLGVGLAFLLGIGTKVAGWVGALMMFLIYLSLFPPTTNPFMDEHLIYILIFIGFTIKDQTKNYGLNNWWKNTSLVRRWPWLE
jgi:thiosulfate dehydrogenase [quinone] large subunit